MTIRERLRDWLAGSDIEERAITPNQLFNTGQWDSYDFLSASGQAVTAQTAMQAAAGACVRLLADDISTLPIDVFVKDGQATLPVDVPSWVESPSGGRFDTSINYVSDWITSMGTDGNAFSLATPNTFEPERLEVLDPQSVDVFEDGGKVRWRVNGVVHDESRVMHVPWVRLPGQLRGINPVAASKDSIGLELAARKWAGAFFREGGTLGGIVRVPGDLTPEQTNTLREQFEARHQGERNWWKPGVLTGGAEYDDNALKPGEASLEPLWRHVLEEAARIYHIPPHLLASQDPGGAARASVEERGIGYVRHAVRPFSSRFERSHSRLLQRPQVRQAEHECPDAWRCPHTGRVLHRHDRGQGHAAARRSATSKTSPWDGDLGYLETPNNNAPDEDITENVLPVSVPDIRVDVQSPHIEVPITFADGSIQVYTPVTVEPTTVNVESPHVPVTISEGAIRMDFHADTPQPIPTLLPRAVRKDVTRDRVGQIVSILESPVEDALA